ncbi:MAG: protein phosphatase 2C domain-containing protein [Candidatus Dormibacteraceae bacterium]
MQVTYLSQPSPPGLTNDDFVIASNSFVIVLDGATAAPHIDTGCIHDVPWLVAHLGTELSTILTTQPSISLTEALASSIQSVYDSHVNTCDLANPDSPSTTVTVLRERLQDDTIDYLVLSDSAIILETYDGHILPIIDDRTQHLPSYTLEAIRQLRNNPAGFWVAGTRPDAATYAITASQPRSNIRRAALLTDGASRLVERYGKSWKELLDILDNDGPGHLIKLVREQESQTPNGKYRGKKFDDATAAICRLDR